MAKLVRIQHPTPKPLASEMAILPIGLYCNVALQKAKTGQIVEFQAEWRRDKRKIIQMSRIRINTPVFTLLLRSIYGQSMTIAKLFERWEAWAIVEGVGRKGFSRDEAILIEVIEPEKDQ